MGLFARATTKAFDQGVGTLAAGAHILQVGGNMSSAGVAVTVDRALTFVPFWAGVRVLAESVAVLPLNLYRQELDDDGSLKRVPATEHPLYAVTHGSPNPEMTSYMWRESSTAHIVTWGNAYSMIARDGDLRIRELWPLVPDRMDPVRENGVLWYDYTRKDGTTVRFAREDILHVPGLSWDGVKGLPALRYYREALGLGIAAGQHGSKFFENGANSALALIHPKTLSDKARGTLEKSVKERHTGADNAWRTWVLEEGMDLKTLTIPNDDAQWLETRQFQRAEIATALRIPPHMLGDLSHATFSNIEHQSLEFVTYSLMPWLVRWEDQMGFQLLGAQWVGAGGDHYFKFNVNALLRGDIKTRFESYAIGRQWGFMNGDKIADLEDWDHFAGGEEYLVPLNMSTVNPDGSISQIQMTPAGKPPVESGG